MRNLSLIAVALVDAAVVNTASRPYKIAKNNFET